MSKTFKKDRPFGRVQVEQFDIERFKRQKQADKHCLHVVPGEFVTGLQRHNGLHKYSRKNLERATRSMMEKLGLPENSQLEKYAPLVIAMIMASMAVGSMIDADEAWAESDEDNDADDNASKKMESTPAAGQKCTPPGVEEYMKYKSDEVDELLEEGENGICEAAELIKKCAEIERILNLLHPIKVDCSSGYLEDDYAKEAKSRYDRYMKIGVSEEELQKFWRYQSEHGHEYQDESWNYHIDSKGHFISVVEELKAAGVNVNDSKLLNALLRRTRVKNPLVDYDTRLEDTTMLTKALPALQKAGVAISDQLVWGLYSAEKDYLDAIIALAKNKVPLTFKMLHYLTVNDLKKISEEVEKTVAENKGNPDFPDKEMSHIARITATYMEKAGTLHELARSIYQYGDNEEPTEMSDPRAKEPGFSLPAPKETCLPGKLLHVREIGDNVMKISLTCGLSGEALRDVVQATEPRYLQNVEYVAAIIKEYTKQKSEHEENQKNIEEAEKKPFDLYAFCSWIRETTTQLHPLLDAIQPANAPEKSYNMPAIQMEEIKEGESLWEVLDRSVKKNNPLQEAPRNDEEIWEEIKSQLGVKAYYPGDKIGIVDDKKNCRLAVSFLSIKLNKEIEFEVKY